MIAKNPRLSKPHGQAKRPKIAYPPALPITARKNAIVESIRKHRVVIITGETGSGKTTQIPKMCLEAGRGRRGKIGCTQPRRVAAVMVANRIAEELGEALGNTVGYKIRFEDRGGRNQSIKIMTDGILLMEAQADPLLRSYDTIIVDEAHERSLNIDFVLGILKNLLYRRKDLKIIITSATIDTQKFSLAFDGAPIIEVSGRLYPVEVRYTDIPSDRNDNEEESYVEAAVEAVEQLRKDGHRRDILIFMPTERDIRETCDLIEGRNFPDCKVFPMFARLSWSEQQRVFQPTTVQKIIVATNIAETSITIPGIHYVIDTGLARISQYSARSRTTSLPVKAISQSSADQRKGRCGRVENGVCIRLYDQNNFAQRPLYTEPEILRSNLAEVILRMLYLRLSEVEKFPFIDRPNPRHIKDAVDLLAELGAVTTGQKSDGSGGKAMTLTPKGRLMARMPLDPRIARMILEAKNEGCLPEINVIAAALSIQDPRERPVEEEAKADTAHAIFKDPASDFVTLLNIWTRYQKTWEQHKSRNQMRKFCRDHYLSFKRMREWEDVYDQITDIVEEQPYFSEPAVSPPQDGTAAYAALHKSILSGYLSNIAVKKEKHFYTATKGREAMIFPGSGLFNKGGNWIVAAEMVETSRLFARTVATIESDWLEALGGPFCRSVYSEPHWGKNRGEVVAFEQVSLFGLVIVPRRSVSYGRIDPAEASQIFIRSALVQGEVKTPLPFLTHNLKLVERISALEDKIRRHDLLAGEEAIARFYEDRLSGIYDIRTLQKVIKEKGSDAFLRMTEEDVLINEPDVETVSQFPDQVRLGHFALPCTYRFEPSAPDDGVTIRIPAPLMPAVPVEAIDWLIPGLLKDKIAALLKGLPKEYRKKLQPLAQTAEIVYTALAPAPRSPAHHNQPSSGKADGVTAHERFHDRGSLINALGKCIREQFGISFPASAWSFDAAADHVKTRVAVIDNDGRVLTATRDLASLHKDLVEAAESQLFSEARKKWEKEGLSDWDFGELPDIVYLGKSGDAARGCAFPALNADEERVNLRLFKTRPEAEAAHLKGIVALYKIHFSDELKYLRKTTALTGEMKIWAPHFCGVKPLEKSLVERVMLDLFGKDIRNRAAFLQLAETMGSRILTRGQEILAEIRPILQAYYETVTFFKHLEKTHRANGPALAYLAELKNDLQRLMPHDFLALYGSERLAHLPRYIKAVKIRADRGLLHLEKAYARENEVKDIENAFDEIRKNLPPHASAQKLAAVEEYYWMIEEYKVSLFAQELKTAFPVSRKRLDQKLQEIEETV